MPAVNRLAIQFDAEESQQKRQHTFCVHIEQRSLNEKFFWVSDQREMEEL
jgi:hypothetical protein